LDFAGRALAAERRVRRTGFPAALLFSGAVDDFGTAFFFPDLVFLFDVGIDSSLIAVLTPPSLSPFPPSRDTGRGEGVAKPGIWS
jgi:hypothetical protein